MQTLRHSPTIIDAKRRIDALGKRLLRWSILKYVFDDGTFEQRFLYQLNVPSVLYISPNEYATIREITYIVKKFELTMEEVETCEED